MTGFGNNSDNFGESKLKREIADNIEFHNCFLSNAKLDNHGIIAIELPREDSNTKVDLKPCKQVGMNYSRDMITYNSPKKSPQTTDSGNGYSTVSANTDMSEYERAGLRTDIQTDGESGKEFTSPGFVASQNNTLADKDDFDNTLVEEPGFKVVRPKPRNKIRF
jgi:hypothetical protein